MNDNSTPTREEITAKIDMLLIAIDTANKRVDDLRDSINRTFCTKPQVTSTRHTAPTNNQGHTQIFPLSPLQATAA